MAFQNLINFKGKLFSASRGVSGKRGHRGDPKRLYMERKAKHVQRALFRGHMVRHLGKDWLYKISTKVKKPKRSRQLDKYLAALDCYGGNRSGNKPPWLDEGYSTWCAVRIQSWWRMLRDFRRTNYRRRIYFQIAAMEIQAAWRTHFEKVQEARAKIRKHSGKHIAAAVLHARATTIQHAWRRFCSIRVYRYFKDLILTKMRGLPADILRSIIPSEIALLDKAAGVHVKFRLGGAIFPPKIYFKIFTHRGVCDVNAFAPRDYTKERQLEAYQLHTKSTMIPETVKMKTYMRVGGSYFGTVVIADENYDRNWYRRDENNFWRPIASQVVNDLFTPPWMQDDGPETAKNVSLRPFHFSKLKRREAIQMERKRRKREWMLKAYLLAAGRKSVTSDQKLRRNMTDSTEKFSNSSQFASLEDGNEEGNTDNVVQEYVSISTEEYLQAVKLMDEVKYVTRPTDTEDDELLKWSMALDFEAYNNEWTLMGSTMPSDVRYSDVIE